MPTMTIIRRASAIAMILLSIIMTKKSEINADINSYSNNSNPCATSGDNNDNNMEGNKISASTPTPSNRNADNALLERNNKNNVIRLPRFIGHPNGIVLLVFKQKQSTTKQSIIPRHKITHESLVLQVLKQQ